MKTALEQRDLRRASELQLQLWLDGPSRKQSQVNPHIRESIAEMNRVVVANKTWLSADLTPVDPLVPPAVDRFGDIRIPTLAVAGALDEPAMLVAAGTIAASIEQAQMTLMSECGYMLTMEQPEVFMKTGLEFLSAV